MEFHPDEADRWSAAGFTAAAATAWFDAGFDSPDEAADWADAGIDPDTAMGLAATGASPSRPARTA
ncbi:hypothetical protein DVS28_b0253 (plasmid) [Euzebya pacifica]|uniref:Uncharacterized protein n=1 Tax=Euzebya pacifica TaxID=1608957 RepID=A0A346Y6C6_9ACTN|nr:hypothetical protein DVS28_b0253 [Euzebya pacifica]